MWKTRTPLVTLHLFFHSHHLNVHVSFSHSRSQKLFTGPIQRADFRPQWIRLGRRTDGDLVKVVAAFALCLVGAMVVERAACPHPLPALTDLDRPRGLADDGRERGKRDWERELQGNFIPWGSVAAGVTWSQCGHLFHAAKNQLDLKLAIYLICFNFLKQSVNKNLIRYCYIHAMFLSLRPWVILRAARCCWYSASPF